MRGRTILLALAAAIVFAPHALAGPGVLVGVDDDTIKWGSRPQTLVAVYRDLGVQAVRVTLRWHPGEAGPDRNDRTQLDRVNVAAWGMRVVLAVDGPTNGPPADDATREQFAAYVANVLLRYPSVNDVVIWTEPNSSAFWRPQAGAAAAYEALLARSFDVLHAVRPGVNVIAASAPHQAPAAWYAGLGAALRASGRTQPIFETVGHNGYPETSAEAPAARHTGASIDQGDYGRLVTALRTAFAGTPQRVTSIWTMEDGFQSRVADGGRAYSGTETDRHAVTEATQADRLAAAVRLAYCQPLVGAFFNFELRDEASLAGWQSGVLRADWSPKPSFFSLRQAIADVRAHRVRCGA